MHYGEPFQTLEFVIRRAVFSYKENDMMPTRYCSGQEKRERDKKKKKEPRKVGWNATGFIMQHLSQLGDSLTGPSQANVFVFVYLSRTCPCSPTP